MSQINIHITDEDGTVLDSMKVERDEFVTAQSNAMAALVLVSSIDLGTE